MYTSVHIIPERKRKWMPDSDFLMKLFEHIGIEKVWILTGYSKPLLWNSEFWRFEVFKEKNLAPEIAIKTWLERKAKVTDFDVDAEWGIDLEREMREYAKHNTYDRFIPSRILLCIGPFSICDKWCEKTVARGSFAVVLHSDGMPKDWDAYMDVLRKTKEVSSLLEFLEKTSGMPWTMLMSSSY